MPRPQPEAPIIKQKNYLTINKIALTGAWDHRDGAAVRPHAIRQAVMDRANTPISRLEAAQGALPRGQGFVVAHTVGADQVAAGLRSRRCALKPGRAIHGQNGPMRARLQDLEGLAQGHKGLALE